MKETPSDEGLDKDVKDFRAFKEKKEAEMAKELKEDLEKFDQRPKPAYYSETMKSSMRGDIEQPPAETSDGDDEPVEATGPLSMSTDLQAAIADAHHLPPEQRAQAVAEMHKKYGKEIANMRTGVLRDGKGVFFIDASGKEFTISYE